MAVLAVLSAGFAALTAIFAKARVANVNSDFATLVCTIAILVTLAFMLTLLGEWQPRRSVCPPFYLVLILSGLATGGSWICYFRAFKIGDAARVAPIEKLSLVLVTAFRRRLPGRAAQQRELVARCSDRGRRNSRCRPDLT